MEPTSNLRDAILLSVSLKHYNLHAWTIHQLIVAGARVSEEAATLFSTAEIGVKFLTSLCLAVCLL